MKRKGSGYSQERKRDQDAKNATEHIPPPTPTITQFPFW